MSRFAGLLPLVLLLAGCESAGDASLAAVQEALASIHATTSEVSGEAQVKRAGEPIWEPVRIGTVYRPGDWVRTGAGGRVRVEFLSGGSVVLDGESVAIIDALHPDAGGRREALLALESGVLHGFLPEGEGRRSLLLKVGDGPNARVVAREGEALELRLAKTEEGTELSVETGAASLKWSGGTHALEPGRAATIGKGRVTEVELLGPPRLASPGVDARFLFRDGGLVKLAWSAVTGADGYRVQVARDARFRRRLATTRSTEADHFFAPEAPGLYLWRVASRDARGRYGRWSAPRRFFVEAVKPADILLEPQQGARFGYAGGPPRIRFSWRPVEGTGFYRLVIGRTRDPLRSVVHSEITEDPRVEVQRLRPGTYWWAVYQDGPVPAALCLAPRRLVIRSARLRTPASVHEWGLQ